VNRPPRESVVQGLRPVTAPFLVCLVGIALSTADQSLFSYAIPEITAEFGIGLEVIGQMLSLSFLVASFMVVLAGLASDRFGRKRIFTLLLLFPALCVAAHAFVDSLGMLATLRVLGFALGAGLYPIANTVVMEWAPNRCRGLVSGFLQMGYPLGFAFASLVATPVMAEHGWRAVFLFAFVIAALAPVLGHFLPESPRFQAVQRQGRVRRPFFSGLGELFAPELRAKSTICFVGTFLISLAIGGTTYFLPVFLVETHSLESSTASRIAGSAYAIGAIGYAGAAIVGEYVTTRRNALIMWVLAGAACFAVTLWVPQTPLVVGLGLSILFFYGSEAVRTPLIAELYPTELRATAAATTGSLAVTTAWLASPLVISYAAPQFGWAATFTACAVVPLCLGGLAFLLLENRRSGAPMEERDGMFREAA
jgi:MFS family permease